MYKKFLAFLLKFVDPHKPFGTALFNAIARISPNVAIDAVALQKNGESGEWEVFVTQRSLSEKAFPGMWDLPGTVIRSGEKIDQAIHRLSKKEFHAPISEFTFLGTLNFPNEPRGHFVALVFLVVLSENPSIGRWLPVNRLDNTVVEFQRKYDIPMALQSISEGKNYIPKIFDV